VVHPGPFPGPSALGFSCSGTALRMRGAAQASLPCASCGSTRVARECTCGGCGEEGEGGEERHGPAGAPAPAASYSPRHSGAVRGDGERGEGKACLPRSPGSVSGFPLRVLVGSRAGLFELWKGALEARQRAHGARRYGGRKAARAGTPACVQRPWPGRHRQGLA